MIGVAGLLAIAGLLPRLGSVSRTGFWLATGLGFALLRGSHLAFLWMGVPDAGRSLIIDGIQIHHIVSGIALCAIAAWGVPRRWADTHPLFTAFAYGAAFALVADEVFYMLFTPVTDQSYMSPISLIGIAAICAGVYGYLRATHAGPGASVRD